MKIKNLTKLHILVLMLVASSAMILQSCKDDDKIVEGDKTTLTALIATADSVATAATTDDFKQSDIDTYKETLAAVKTTAATPLTQTQIDALVANLSLSKTTFLSKAYGYVDEALYLNAGWHFDEGTGTTATAFSTIKHVGTFTKGNVTLLGAAAAMPTWVTGLKGGKAIYLNNGAHLEVPYTTAFLPTSITISAWIKMDEIYENDIIVSQNYWWGYKFQTQSAGKPFFTYKSTKTANSIIDADDASGTVGAGTWSHVVVSLNSETKILKFYINGTLTKTWNEADKGIGAMTQTLVFTDNGATIAAQPFIIGAWATDAEMARNMSWASANYGFFKGAIDELKIYNIALTDGQVARLYKVEKP